MSLDATLKLTPVVFWNVPFRLTVHSIYLILFSVPQSYAMVPKSWSPEILKSI
jgi:hypothetical protein